MKLKDIKVGDYVAARVKRYARSSSTTERCRVKAIDGRDITLIVPAFGEERRVYFTVIDATWADHEAALAREQRVYEAAKKRQRAAWDARRAAERERFEENILPAFKGLPAPEHMPPGRYGDLAEYIADMMLEGGSSTIQFRESDLRAIAARVIELGNVIAQTALTADDLPQAGWGITDEQRAAQLALEQDEERVGDLPVRTIIEVPLADLGLNVPDGDS